MYTKLSKIALVLAIGFYASLVVFNNITDYNSNYQYVYHVLKMDTTFSNNHAMWRSIDSSLIYHVLYIFIMFIEAVIAGLCWFGGFKLFKSRNNTNDFNQAKGYAVLGLTLGILLWFSGFFTIGGEWFLGWQSKDWNARASAFRIIVIFGLVLLYLTMPNNEKEA